MNQNRREAPPSGLGSRLKTMALSMKPTGWFQVGWSEAIGPGDVRPLRYFGEDLVMFRSRTGELAVLNAHCQHLGANLAYGGCVIEDGIQCPFHGWVWSTEGRNVSIPGHDAPNRARRVRPWTVVEKDDVIYLWHDVSGGLPTWEVPDVFVDLGVSVAHKSFHRPYPAGTGRFEHVRVHPQMVLENAVDPGHFRFVHHTPDIPVLLEQDVADTTWFARVGFGKRWHDRPPVGDDVRGTLTILFSGVGIGYNALVDRDVTAVVLIATTPVDDEHSDIFQTVWLECVDGESDEEHQARLDTALGALPEDVNIWHHQKYLDPAGLTADEVRGFNQIRRWGKRFYP